MNLYDLMVAAGMKHLVDLASDEDMLILLADLEVRAKFAYPLKGRVSNVRMLDGSLEISCRFMPEYGSDE